MAEESKEAARGTEEKAPAAEAKEELKAAIENGENISVIKEKAKRFEQFQDRYLKDPSFKEVVEGAWSGKKYMEFKEQVEKQAASIDDPYEAIRSDLQKSKEAEQKLRKDLDETRDFVSKKELANNRFSVTNKYEDEFMDLAEGKGYTPGSPAYKILFDNAEKAGYNIAKRKGFDDWADNYRPGFMKEAFEAAFEVHKKAGFDEAWNKRQQVMAEEERLKNVPKDLMDIFFEKNKDLMKTRDGRQKAAKDYFKTRFPDADKMKF